MGEKEYGDEKLIYDIVTLQELRESKESQNNEN